MAEWGTRGPDWADWVAALPRLIGEILGEWELVPDGSALNGHTAVVIPVRDQRGEARALKLAFPDSDSRGEIPTLQLWGGRSAVRLVRADPRRGVLLLEWLGDSLAEHWDADAATRITAGLYGHLHRRAAPQLPDLHERVHRWLAEFADLGRRVPAPPRLIEYALAAGRRLAAEPGTHVVHGDLHDANVMAREAEWVAIDPKGYNGDPCFEPAPLLWNRWDELTWSGNTSAAIRERFWTIVDTADLDEARARDWVVVRCLLNVGWQAIDGDRPVGDISAHEWITRNVTIAKAIQSIEL